MGSRNLMLPSRFHPGSLFFLAYTFSSGIFLFFLAEFYMSSSSGSNDKWRGGGSL